MDKALNIGLISLGCDKNRVDAEKILAYICKNTEFALTSDLTFADVVIINTCGFIQDACKESLDAVFETRKSMPNGLIIVTGCLAERYFSQLSTDLYEADMVLKLSENILLKDILIKYAKIKDEFVNASVTERKEMLSALRGNFREIEDKHSFLFDVEDRVLSTPLHYAYLKIADGCNNRCSYCSIPSIRGDYVSNSIGSIRAELQNLLNDFDLKEVILVAQDVTRYGLDNYKRRALTQLLDNISESEIQWIRLNYLYPDELNDSLLDYIFTSDKICKYFDIPLQHISDNVLKNMRRRSTKQSITELLDKIKSKAQKYGKKYSVRTTIMVGFPGETEADFKELVEFIKSAKLENVGFFKFSAEEGTSAEKLKDQIPEDVKEQRLQYIQGVQNQVYLVQCKEAIGSIKTVLIDGVDMDNGYFYGHDEFSGPDNDRRVVITKSVKPVEVGSFAKVKITGYDLPDYVGELIEE